MTALAFPTVAPLLPADPVERPYRMSERRLSCTILRDVDALASLRDEWDALAAEVTGAFTMSADWCRAWWAHDAAARTRGWRAPAPREARIFLFRDGAELVGAIPMFVERTRLGPFALRTARLIGAEGTGAAASLPVRSTWLATALDELLQRLVADERVDALVLGPLTDGAIGLDALRDAARRRRDLLTVERDDVVGHHTTLALPDRFDDLVAAMPGHLRTQVRRCLGAARAAGGVTIDAITDPATRRAEIDRLLDAGRAVAPEARAFERTAADLLGDLGRAHLVRVEAAGTVLARRYGIAFGDVGHLRLASSSPRPVEGPRDPAMAGRVALLERFHAAGLRTIDFGTTDRSFARRLGAKAHRLRRLVLVADRPGARRRTHSMLRAVDAVSAVWPAIGARLDRPAPRWWRPWASIS